MLVENHCGLLSLEEWIRETQQPTSRPIGMKRESDGVWVRTGDWPEELTVMAETPILDILASQQTETDPC